MARCSLTTVLLVLLLSSAVQSAILPKLAGWRKSQGPPGTATEGELKGKPKAAPLPKLRTVTLSERSDLRGKSRHICIVT